MDIIIVQAQHSTAAIVARWVVSDRDGRHRFAWFAAVPEPVGNFPIAAAQRVRAL